MSRLSAAALGAALVFATATSAVAQEKGRGERRRATGAGFDAPRPVPSRAILRGIQLSDGQREQVKGIRERYQPQYKAVRDSLRPAAEQARAARQRGDTAGVREAWSQTADERQQMLALSQKEAGEIRALLTPDQQKVFDQNLAAWQERGRDAVREHVRRKRGRNGRPGAGL